MCKKCYLIHEFSKKIPTLLPFRALPPPPPLLKNPGYATVSNRASGGAADMLLLSWQSVLLPSSVSWRGSFFQNYCLFSKIAFRVHQKSLEFFPGVLQPLQHPLLPGGWPLKIWPRVSVLLCHHFYFSAHTLWTRFPKVPTNPSPFPKPNIWLRYQCNRLLSQQ